MTLKRRLQLNVVLSMLTACVVSVGLLLSLYRLERANQGTKTAGEIMTCLLEQVTLRNDYLRNGSARAREQFTGKQEQLDGLLASMSASVLVGRKVDAVVTDLVMPRMGGDELAARIRADHPGAKILLVSGYTEHSGALKDALERGAAFLQKPYTPSALTHRVRELLGPRRPGA